jgi:P-type conjugative transfer protein TrbG
MPRPIIIDTDPSPDDAVAILMALASPEELEVLAVTTVAGNVPVNLTSKNARKALALARRTETPVYAGASAPLLRPLVTAEEVHGKTGFDGYDLPDPITPLAEGFAPDAIVDLVMRRPRGEVTLCCLAPLTNIALAMAKEPRQAGRDKWSRTERLPTQSGCPADGDSARSCARERALARRKNAPSQGPDGRVMYSFGARLPTVVCAPLRVCMIELQAGEKIVGEPHIGDSVRWNISPAMYGTGEQATAVIILKPQTPGLDTNLLITTDRRAYYLRLISKPEDYVARVAFAYPEDDTRKWQQQQTEQLALAKQEKHASEAPPAVLTVEKVNFDYTIRGGDEHIRPVRVFDDGAKTYIQMAPELQHREAPVLLVVGKDGKGEMTNYRVKDQIYIVDRLFDRASLVLGSGKKAQKVEISRGHKQ